MESNKTEVAKIPVTTFSLFAKDDVKKKFQEILGKKSQGFITSVLQIVSSNTNLKNADPLSVYNAASVAAVLDLPINNNLGFAYIVPYNESYKDGNDQWQKRQVAQFQLGYKGFIQLALRSGQFKTIAATPIYEGQLIDQNPLTGFVFDFTKKTSETVIGFASYFSLINGFEKTWYMSVDQMKAHGKKYSKTFALKTGRWELDFEGMGNKTVLKLLLSKYAPLSIEMQKAMLVDQAVIKNEEGTEVVYADVVDHPEEITKEDVELLYDMKRELCSKDEKTDIQRIFDGNETNSYKKIQTLLKSK